MAKKQSISRLKKLLWPQFSLYIRRRDSNWKGMAQCVSCGITKHYKELQAGHFIPGRHNAVLYDERNCHAQCYRCNIPLKGNSIPYYQFMQKKYGDKVIEELIKLDRQNKQFTGTELHFLLDHYKELNKKHEL